MQKFPEQAKFSLADTKTWRPPELTLLSTNTTLGGGIGTAEDPIGGPLS